VERFLSEKRIVIGLFRRTSLLEMISIIETGRTEAAAAIDISASHLAGRTADEIVNALLRFGPCVDVIVTRYGDVHSITSVWAAERLLCGDESFREEI
jgi:hypothetical protein